MQKKPPPTITQRNTIADLNEKLGTNYNIPETENDARFLIDGMIDEERKKKRQQHPPLQESRDALPPSPGNSAN